MNTDGCGSGHACTCSGAVSTEGSGPDDDGFVATAVARRPGAASATATIASPAVRPAHETRVALEAQVARVNGVALNGPDEPLDAEALRQRACTELLRQAAQRAGLLAASDAPGERGAISSEASAAIEALLDRELSVPEPDEAALRRHYEAHVARYATGERVLARHVLFAVTEGTDVVALRKHAEGVLLDVRSHGSGDDAGDGTQDGAPEGRGDAFARAAKRWSNCPSGEQGGDLGWLDAADCAPEFARELFGHPEVGVLPRLVHSRFGLHVVEVLARQPGIARPFEAVKGAVALALRQQAFVTALRQYLSVLGGQATLQGVTLDAADSPLVQ
jgi:peptidyl-prolyl cis-trans isomerase C